MKYIFIIVAIITLVGMYIFRGNVSKYDTVKVYGSMSCGWTRKQLKELGNRATFVDCTQTQCPAWVTGFPGVETTDGKKIVGYVNNETIGV